jgi:hypothetical protein
LFIGPQNLCLSFRDFSQAEITSVENARHQKDSIFNLFFDYDTLGGICAGRGLNFAHNMTFLPGCKYVRILGEKRTVPIISEETVRRATKMESMPWAQIHEQWQRVQTSKCTVNNEAQVYQNTIKRLSKSLKTRMKRQDRLDDYIKEQKVRWLHEVPLEILGDARRQQQPRENKSNHVRLNKLKNERTGTMKQVEDTRKDLSEARF